MALMHRPTGLKAGIAIGAAIALVGVLMGIAVASIPAGNGTISACYSSTTGALRVIDSPSKHCGSGEKPIRWNQSGPASLAALEGTPCTLPATHDATLHVDVSPVGGNVTFQCSIVLRVTSTVTLSRIVLQIASVPATQNECDNAKSCSLAVPLGTPDAKVQLFASADFKFACPGATPQGASPDLSRTLYTAECLMINMSSVRTATVTAP
jgi:hypothetical protein